MMELRFHLASDFICDSRNKDEGMGNVIKFPRSKCDTKPIPPPLEVNKLTSAYESVLSPEEDEAFLGLVREWPCFFDLSREVTLADLLEGYYNDELTLSQDCVLEFLFHMHDPESAFDIGNALYTWEEDDRNFFLLSINIHAEIIDKLKREE